jgi:ketosteroid isomerase-like protein
MSSDEAAVLSLLGRYCHALDGDDLAAVLDCFTEDGVFAYFALGAAEPLLRFEGHAEIAAWFADHRSKTPLGAMTHVTVNPSIELDGDEATAASTYVSLRARDGGIVVGSTGRYADRAARGADGRWRLAERLSHADMPRPGL